MTDRNRQFLRQFTPVTQAQPGSRPDFVDPEPQVNLPQNPVLVVSDPEPVISVPEPVVSVPVPQTPTPSPQVAQPTTPGSPVKFGYNFKLQLINFIVLNSRNFSSMYFIYYYESKGRRILEKS